MRIILLLQFDIKSMSDQNFIASITRIRKENVILYSIIYRHSVSFTLLIKSILDSDI